MHLHACFACARAYRYGQIKKVKTDTSTEEERPQHQEVCPPPSLQAIDLSSVTILKLALRVQGNACKIEGIHSMELVADASQMIDGR